MNWTSKAVLAALAATLMAGDANAKCNKWTGECLRKDWDNLTKKSPVPVPNPIPEIPENPDWTDIASPPGVRDLDPFNQHIATEATVETVGPILEGLIISSRDNHIRAGVQPLPANIFNAMSVYYPRDFLTGVRFRIGHGSDLSLSAGAFRYGGAAAITLGHVIVFRNGDYANDLDLWAHELAHVQQYKGGIGKFAKRYIRNHAAVEDEAHTHAERWRAVYDQATNSSDNGEDYESHAGGLYDNDPPPAPVYSAPVYNGPTYAAPVYPRPYVQPGPAPTFRPFPGPFMRPYPRVHRVPPFPAPAYPPIFIRR